MLFQIGRLYSRSADIHDRFAGSRQSGISPSAKEPLIFLFTGDSGDRYGYTDGWADGIFHYCGEGQRGDMEFSRNNKALRDHAKDGRDLHLFTALGKGKPCRYEGAFACSGWHWGEGADIEGMKRKTIIFHLVSLEDLVDTSLEPDDSRASHNLPLDEMRALAIASVAGTDGEAPSSGRRNIYNRSSAVRDYVLARAAGICECCGSNAPFARKDGSPYLEPHHIRRLSDGGPDHPRWVAAVCPNCHRNIHHGGNGAELNLKLGSKVEVREATITAQDNYSRRAE